MSENQAKRRKLDLEIDSDSDESSKLAPTENSASKALDEPSDENSVCDSEKEPEASDITDPTTMKLVARVMEAIGWTDSSIYKKLSEKDKKVDENEPIVLERLLILDSRHTMLCINMEMIVFDNDKVQYGSALASRSAESKKIDDGIEKSIMAIEAILRIPRLKINQFIVELKKYHLSERIQSLFESLPHKISAKLLCLSSENEPGDYICRIMRATPLDVFRKWEKDVMKVLPYLEPGYLEEITIHYSSSNGKNPFLNLRGSAQNAGLFELEQWKQAKEIGLNRFKILSTDVELFTHLNKFAVTVDTIDTEMMLRLKEKVLENPDFVSAKLSIFNKMPDVDRSKLKKCPIPGTTDKFLVYYEDRVGFRRDVFLEVVSE